MKIFQGKIVFIDTAPLIYYIEGHSEWQQTHGNFYKE